MLSFHDYCDRLIRYEGGDKEWLRIPRCQCDKCKRIHRMLPDILLPFKHYSQPVITDSIDDRIKPQSSDDSPSEASIKRWKHWLMANVLQIDGYIKSIGHRVLGFSEELLKTSISPLEYIRSSLPFDWLKVIIQYIYNAGAFLDPCYD